MKSKFLSIASAAVLLLGAAACQEPHEFNPAAYDKQFDSMTASFYDDDRTENSFAAEFDYDNHVITIVMPYTYPAMSDSHLEMSDLTRMRVICNLKNGVTLSPALTWLDLSKEHQVTVTDNGGNKTAFTIRAEIRKSKECVLKDFSIEALGLSGVINEEGKTISLVTADAIGEQNAKYDISFGATISPDPAVTAVDFDSEPVLTVTAQDGETKAEYKVIKTTPKKLPFGFRAGSESVVWARKHADVGLTVLTAGDLGSSSPTRFNGSAGLAFADGCLVLNESGTGKAFVLNYKNGQLLRTLDLTSLGTNSLGQYNNYRMTSDDNNNILIASPANFNSNVLTIWRMKGLDGTPEKYITFEMSGAIGNVLSVTGNLDGDAIITTNRNGGMIVYRWDVRGGQLVSQKPVEVSPSGYAANCWGTYDAVYLEPKDDSDFIGIGYVAFNPVPAGADNANHLDRTCAWIDGKTNAIKHYGSKFLTSNSPENAGDLIEFNSVKFYIHNVFNTLAYGHGASLVMYDLSTNDLSTPVLDFSEDGPLHFCKRFGAEAGSNTVGKAANGNDVRFYVSPDGFFLYIFFEYTNGFVGAIRLDCIEM